MEINMERNSPIGNLKALILLLLLVINIEVTACRNTSKKDTSIKSWILNNQRQLKLELDTIFRRDKMKMDSNWISFSIVIRNTIHPDDSLSGLAKKAGDSNMCIVIAIDFYKDSAKKRRIMIAAEDSTCLKKLQMIELDTDSTGEFVFGKIDRPLH